MNATILSVQLRKILLLTYVALTGFTDIALKAQTDESSFQFKVTGDLVSSYVWRGSLATARATPNFQPAVAFMKENFEIGVWGSTDFAGNYKEVDPYISLTTRYIKFGITDYNWNFDQADYFNYKNSETGHKIEGTIGFTGTGTFPVSVTWNTVLYGFDKKSDDSTKQAYSTYVEVNYAKGPVSIFLGFTPWPGYYNNYGVMAFDSGADKKSFSIVNIGTSITKSLKINETFSLPLKVTLIFNPSGTYSRNDFVHLVFGLTF
jgi:hypothetical protein